MGNQPTVIVHPRSSTEWVLDGVAVAAALGCVALAATNYGSLPDTIPTHFGPSGDADGWGSKAFVWLLPTIAVIVIPLIVFLCGKPQRFNYLGNVKAENAQSEYARTRLTLRLLNTVIGCLLLLLTWAMANPDKKILGAWLLPIILLAVLAPLIINFIHFFRKN